jgi:hypothetical protein
MNRQPAPPGSNLRRGCRAAFVVIFFGILGACFAATLGYLILENDSEWGGFFGTIIGLPIGAIGGVVFGILANRSFDKHRAK